MAKIVEMTLTYSKLIIMLRILWGGKIHVFQVSVSALRMWIRDVPVPGDIDSGAPRVTGEVIMTSPVKLLSQSRVGYRGDEPSVRRAEASARPNPPYTLLWTETHVFTFEF